MIQREESRRLLNQNKGKQTAVINALMTLRGNGASTIAQAKKSASWSTVIRKISRTVAAMSVQYLQGQSRNLK